MNVLIVTAFLERRLMIIHLLRVYYKMYSVRCTVYSVQCTVYSVRCTVYGVQCTVYSVRCTVYGVRCTIYRVYSSSHPRSGCGVVSCWCRRSRLNMTRHAQIRQTRLVTPSYAQTRPLLSFGDSKF